jgi:hypothetical protein
MIIYTESSDAKAIIENMILSRRRNLLPAFSICLFLFTDQPVPFLHALTAKPGISALSFAVLPVTCGIHCFFFGQLFFRRIKLVNVM